MSCVKELSGAEDINTCGIVEPNSLSTSDWYSSPTSTLLPLLFNEICQSAPSNISASQPSCLTAELSQFLVRRCSTLTQPSHTASEETTCSLAIKLPSITPCGFLVEDSTRNHLVQISVNLRPMPIDSMASEENDTVHIRNLRRCILNHAKES